MSVWTCRQSTARPTERLFRLVLKPEMEGPWCRFRREARACERRLHRPVVSLKALDPTWPIREADIQEFGDHPNKNPRTLPRGLRLCATRSQLNL